MININQKSLARYNFIETTFFFYFSKLRLVHVHSGVRQYREPDSNGCWKVVTGSQADESSVHKVRMIPFTFTLFDSQRYFERTVYVFRQGEEKWPWLC